MNGFFRIDGPLYKIGNILFYLLVSNFLWIIFSLPLFTIGASTTALFYVIGKAVRDEDVKIIKDYWKSFKQNFKQATIIWMIIAVIFFIVYSNISNIKIFGNMSRFILPVQVAILIELGIVTIYIFPILSRYNMTMINAFKSSFFMGNRNIITTLLCIASFVVVGFLLYQFPGLFILMPVSLYAICSYALIYRLFLKYVPEEKKMMEIARNEKQD